MCIRDSFCIDVVFGSFTDTADTVEVAALEREHRHSLTCEFLRVAHVVDVHSNAYDSIIFIFYLFKYSRFLINKRSDKFYGRFIYRINLS